MKVAESKKWARWAAALIGVCVWTPANAGTFNNTTPIIIPAIDTGANNGAPANPYPSVISVTGIPANEVISGLTVTLLDFSHVFPDDVDALLIGPNGVRVMLMSDAGAFSSVSGIDLTFDDDAADSLPDAAAITTGAYRPTNYGSPDAFPAPVPNAAHGSSLSVFVDLQPNGDWSLYVVDDAEFDVGTIASGWRLSFTTLTTQCGNEVTETGEDCDDGNFVGGDGCGPTCLFEVCGNGYIDPGEDCDDGNFASGDGCNSICKLEFCGDGVVQKGIGESCEDGNAVGGDGCSPQCTTEVCGNSIVDPGEECDDGNTVPCDGCDTCAVVGPPFCNQTAITIPTPGALFQPAPASPYPSVFTVTGIPDNHVVSGLTVSLVGFSHVNPDDVDMLLVGPDGTTIFLMSDAGGATDVVNADLTFADGATQLPDNTAITSGTFAPTNHGTPDGFPSPAPAEPYAALLSAFIGSEPNGNWSLYVADDQSIFETGSIAGGWTLNMTTSFAQCGNGEVEPGEQCDDGNLLGGDGCGPLCNLEVCGNGTVDPKETCDDANTVPCDGCDECTVESAPVCGNAVTECGEDCDDANLNQTDGCLADCKQGPAVPPPPPDCPAATMNSFPSTDTPISITAAGTPTITSTITVAGVVAGPDPYIHDVNVTTQITHTACGDLDITLTSPSGKSVTLTTDNGGASDDVFNGTVWDDQADSRYAGQFSGFRLATDAVYSNAVTKELLTPEEPLAAFDGENPNGIWTLTVSDDTDGNGGDLLGWSLSIATLLKVPTFAVGPAVGSAPALTLGPGLESVTDSINYFIAGNIGKVAVQTDITHTQNTDLDITLTSPSGTIVTLTTDNGGPNDNAFASTLWTDDADPGNPAPYPQPNPASDLVTDTAYVNLVPNESLVPEEPLAAFKGENPNGTWTITVKDDANPNGGTLNSWSVTIITYSCEEPPPFCALRGGKDDPCFELQALDCAGSGEDLCRPKEVMLGGNDVVATVCDCYPLRPPCDIVLIGENSISCGPFCGPIFRDLCTVVQDGTDLYISRLDFLELRPGSVYTCGCVEPVPGDLDIDGDVDMRDITIFDEQFGRTSPSFADFNNDGNVDRVDWHILLENLTGPNGA